MPLYTIAAPILKTFTQQNHPRFYQPLVLFLTSFSSSNLGLAATYAGSSPCCSPQDRFHLAGMPNVSGASISFSPAPILNAMVLDQWPPSIDLLLSSSSAHPAQVPKTASITTVNKATLLLEFVLQSFFLNYFDSNFSAAIARHAGNIVGGKDKKRLHLHTACPEWYFAWNVRNAFGHGGLINITDKTLPPATWFGCSFDHNTNGQAILHNLLALADMILLVEELDKKI